MEPSADPRKYLVLVNPAGGKGKAIHIYQTQIRPLLELAEADCKVIITGIRVDDESVVIIMLYRVCRACTGIDQVL